MLPYPIQLTRFNAKGILSACALCEKLARDRILPNAFLYRLPATNAQAVTIGAFIVLSGTLYASAGASLTIVSKMYVSRHIDKGVGITESLMFLGSL